jgi:signal transduction histidine kinase
LAPPHITFRYILEAFDKNWIDAGTRREALYANLPPGKYVFRVSACNMDGTCDHAGATVAFRLAPHYYQRPWFLAFGAALVGLAAWLIYGLRIRRLREQFELVLGERNRIARELHDTLIQGFAGVTMQMQALCARLSSRRETNALEEIIADATAALRDARLSVAGLRGARGPSSVRPPAGLPQQVEYNLLRIAQEALANALRHSGARTIEVSVESSAESLDLAIKDDGAGMAVPADNVSDGHYGLLGMRERASLIGAGLKIESKPGGGTTVRVRMPASEVR